MTKEEFNKTVEVGDIVTVIGLKDPVDCVVMTKTEYACNLFTVDQGNTADGIMPLHRFLVVIIKQFYDEIGICNGQ